MDTKSFYEKPEMELVALRMEWDFVVSGKTEGLTETRGEWEDEI